MVSLPLDDNSGVSTIKSYFKSLKEKASEKSKVVVAGGLAILLTIIILFSTGAIGYLKIALQSIEDVSVCPLSEPLAPASFYKDNTTVLRILNDEKFRLKSVQKLSGAVQIDTTIFDNQPDVSEDPKVWEKFADFHLYLQTTFPTVFALLEVEYVNTYGIVLYWKGSNKSLKPLMLTAHQDVVPVQKATLGDWSYPPFEGHYDGEYLYGRGSSDCKNVLISIMETFELYIEEQYKPERGIVAAFGFDEEASGIISASKLAKYLEKKFGKDSMYAIIDEGVGLIKDASTGQIVAVPGTGEKGYLDVKVNLKTPGGHSSVPPDHTSIGLMSELAYLIEKDPYEPILTTKNPILKYLQCSAVHSGDKLSKFTRKTILRAGFDKLANSKVVESLTANPLTRYLISTAQAIDIIKGGEKANALPESVQLIVNHRIALESSVDETKSRFVSRVKTIASKHDLGLESFGETILEPTTKGNFVVDYSSNALEPAPVSPSDDTVWRYLTGVVRHVFEDLVYPDLEYPIVAAPGIMTGNTDTRYYWNLTKNIYRFSPFFSNDMMIENKIHSVDERVRVGAHLELTAFFYQYIQAVDTPDADNK
ncbi:carboxypeptidase S [[Candida] anglica]|uniref:Carboxypeptidase S n=1 Tax=[Candida] anglica TaxID=148631 RepID=A0ABP0E6U4_9ASCO